MLGQETNFWTRFQENVTSMDSEKGDRFTLGGGGAQCATRPREKKPALKKALNGVESFKLSWWPYRG